MVTGLRHMEEYRCFQDLEGGNALARPVAKNRLFVVMARGLEEIFGSSRIQGRLLSCGCDPRSRTLGLDC